MKVEKITEAKEPMELEIAGVTIPSIEEAEQMPITYRRYHNWWWLRSPGTNQRDAASVCSDGSVLSYGYGVGNEDACVRPTLKICNLQSSNLQVGDRLIFGGKQFVVATEDSAFCLEDIGKHCFRKDWEAKDANDYDKSDSKQYVEEWYQNALKESNRMKVTKTTSSTKITELEITGITIPSAIEATTICNKYRRYSNWWWLRTPEPDQDGVALVDIGDDNDIVSFSNSVCDEIASIRPLLKISNLQSSGLKMGDNFTFGNKQFVVVDNDTAFCLQDIGAYFFREDWKAEDAHRYNKSDLKKYVEGWLQEQLDSQENVMKKENENMINNTNEINNNKQVEKYTKVTITLKDGSVSVFGTQTTWSEWVMQGDKVIIMDVNGAWIGLFHWDDILSVEME